MNFGELWMLANAYATGMLKHMIGRRHDDRMPATVRSHDLTQSYEVLR